MQAGQQITQNLRLVRQLGQGGMGSVWVADHLALGTQVAVKFMWRTFAEHPQFLARFRREAAAAAQLKNPHVAQVFDHGVTDEGEAFIVMELLEGEDLGKRIKREGPLAPELTAEVLSQAAKALGKAHQSGIVHRDLKPDNIFLTDLDGEVFVKILDFGIAKVQGDPSVAMTATGGTFGTPLYMSPEQLLSAKHVDHHADLWSLGVVAYYALTRKLPFPGDTIGAISVAVHTGVFERVTTHRPDLPSALDAWFQRIFRKNPKERFSSAKEMADAFRLAIGARITQPVAIPPTAPTPAAPQPPDSSDSRQTLVRPTDRSGAHDTSPRTLDGKAVTLGARPENRAPVVAAGVGGVLLLGALGTIAVVRPWEGGADASTASGTAHGTDTGSAGHSAGHATPPPEPSPTTSDGPSPAGATAPTPSPSSSAATAPREATAPTSSTASTAVAPAKPTSDSRVAPGPGTIAKPPAATASTAAAKAGVKGKPTGKPGAEGDDPGF